MVPNYYTVEQIKELENCGRDLAYSIARKLPHKTIGKKILVLKESYEQYHAKEKEEILRDYNVTSNIYKIRKFAQ